MGNPTRAHTWANASTEIGCPSESSDDQEGQHRRMHRHPFPADHGGQHRRMHVHFCRGNPARRAANSVWCACWPTPTPSSKHSFQRNRAAPYFRGAELQGAPFNSKHRAPCTTIHFTGTELHLHLCDFAHKHHPPTGSRLWGPVQSNPCHAAAAERCLGERGGTTEGSRQGPAVITQPAQARPRAQAARPSAGFAQDEHLGLKRQHQRGCARACALPGHQVRQRLGQGVAQGQRVWQYGEGHDAEQRAACTHERMHAIHACVRAHRRWREW